MPEETTTTIQFADSRHRPAPAGQSCGNLSSGKHRKINLSLKYLA